MRANLSPIVQTTVSTIATATLRVDSPGAGFTDITAEAAAFVAQAVAQAGAQTGAQDGVLLVFLRHTSASLTIQENADPDVLTDLATALDRLAPEDRPWVHDAERPDDMPAHVKAMLNGVSLHIPVVQGKLALGTWQGLYLAEHRCRPHVRQIVFQFVGGSA